MMPNITAAGTYDKQSFHKLAANSGPTYLTFSGSSVGTSTTVQFQDDSGAWTALPSGSITTLPTSLEVRPAIELRVVCVGSTDLNLTITE